MAMSGNNDGNDILNMVINDMKQEIDKINDNNDSDDILNMDELQQEIDNIGINDNNDYDIDDLEDMDGVDDEDDMNGVNDDYDIDDIDDLDDMDHDFDDSDDMDGVADEDDMDGVDDEDDMNDVDDLDDMEDIRYCMYLDLQYELHHRSSRPATGGLVKNRRRWRAIQQKFYEQRMKILTQKRSQVFGNTSICYIISSFLDVETRINARTAKLLR